MQVSPITRKNIDGLICIDGLIFRYKIHCFGVFLLTLIISSTAPPPMQLFAVKLLSSENWLSEKATTAETCS